MWIPWIVIALPMAAFITQRPARIGRGQPPRPAGRRRADRADGRREHGHAADQPRTDRSGVQHPGLYRLIKPALRSRDVAVIQAMMLEGIVLIVVANFL